MRKHTGNKTFSCDQCNQQFQSKLNLDRHYFTKHSSNPISIDLQEDATVEQLQSFENNPVVSLIALATNTGLARFRGFPQPLSENCTTWAADDNQNIPPPDLLNVVNEIGSGVSDAQMSDIIMRFKDSMDLTALLIGCASCGSRAYQVCDIDIYAMPMLAR
jgi:hypothetical protein